MLNKYFLSILIVLLAFTFISCEEFSDPGEGISSPEIISISPDNRMINSPEFILTVAGEDFTNDTVIVFNGKDLETVFVSSSELTAQVKPSDTIPAINTESDSVEPIPYFVPVMVRNRAGTSHIKSFHLLIDFTFPEFEEIASTGWDGMLNYEYTSGLNGTRFMIYQSTATMFSSKPKGQDSWNEPVEFAGQFWPKMIVGNNEDISIFTLGRWKSSSVYFHRSSMDQGSTWSSTKIISSDIKNTAFGSYVLEKGIAIANDPAIPSRVHAAFYRFDLNWPFNNYKMGIYYTYVDTTGVAGSENNARQLKKTFAKPVKVMNFNTYYHHPFNINIKADMAGNIYVLYDIFKKEGTNTRFQTYLVSSTDAGRSWGNKIQLPHDSTSFSSMVVDKKGVLHIVYTAELDDFTTSVFRVRSNDKGRTLTELKNLAGEDAEGYFAFPKIITDSLGNVIIGYAKIESSLLPEETVSRDENQGKARREQSSNGKLYFFLFRSWDGGNNFSPLGIPLTELEIPTLPIFERLLNNYQGNIPDPQTSPSPIMDFYDTTTFDLSGSTMFLHLPGVLFEFPPSIDEEGFHVMIPSLFIGTGNSSGPWLPYFSLKEAVGLYGE